MTIAASVQNHLVREGVSYEPIQHARTLDSSHTAQAAHVPGAQLAKGRVSRRTSRVLSSRSCRPREGSTSAPCTGVSGAHSGLRPKARWRVYSAIASRARCLRWAWRMASKALSMTAL